nr:MAG TPA: hypothetical protein [Caudoviricetes sp.]
MLPLPPVLQPAHHARPGGAPHPVWTRAAGAERAVRLKGLAVPRPSQ